MVYLWFIFIISEGHIQSSVFWGLVFEDPSIHLRISRDDFPTVGHRAEKTRSTWDTALPDRSQRGVLSCAVVLSFLSCPEIYVITGDQKMGHHPTGMENLFFLNHEPVLSPVACCFMVVVQILLLSFTVSQSFLDILSWPKVNI